MKDLKRIWGMDPIFSHRDWSSTRSAFMHLSKRVEPTIVFVQASDLMPSGLSKKNSNSPLNMMVVAEIFHTMNHSLEFKQGRAIRYVYEYLELRH
jgi:hypothetical protein